MNNLLQRLIGKEFKRLRMNDSLSQMAFCEKVGVNYRHYQDLEAGKKNFKIDTLFKISNYYGLNPFSFFIRMFLNNSDQPSYIAVDEGQSCSIELDSNFVVKEVFGHCSFLGEELEGKCLLEEVDEDLKVALQGLYDSFSQTNGSVFGKLITVTLPTGQKTILFLKLAVNSHSMQLAVTQL